MSNNYSEGQAIGFGAADFSEGPSKKMLATVKQSRYVQLVYNTGGFAPGIAVRWTLVTTHEKEFSRDFSTGLRWDEKAAVSEDGRQIVAKAGYSGMSKNSNFAFLRERIITAGFPEANVKNDIGIFDGVCFTFENTKNPRAAGSKEGWYPLTFHPEGMQAVMDSRGWVANPTGVSGVATQPLPSIPLPTAPVIDADTMNNAVMALAKLVADKGGVLKRSDIPVSLGPIAATNKWDDKMRPAVTFALWDVAQLRTVAEKAGLKVDQSGDTITV